MSAPALADVLEDFGNWSAGSSGFEGLALDAAMPEMVVPDAPVLPDIDRQDHVRGEVEKAEAELIARLTEEHEAALARERERHAAELDALDSRHGERLGAALMAELSAVEENVAGIVTAVVARILGPLLTADLQTRMVDSLAAAIGDAMADAENVRVKISGSLALYEALAAAVGDKAAFFDFTESSAVDLSVRIDNRLIESRLSEWSAAMEEML